MRKQVSDCHVLSKPSLAELEGEEISQTMLPQHLGAYSFRFFLFLSLFLFLFRAWRSFGLRLLPVT